jgi:DNA helicase-4
MPRLGVSYLISVGMKLYKEDGNEVTVTFINDDIFSVAYYDEIIVTYNSGNSQEINTIKRDKTYHMDEIGKALFLEFKDTQKGQLEEERKINEEKARKQLEYEETIKQNHLNELKIVLDRNYLHSRAYFEKNMNGKISENEFDEYLTKYVTDWFSKKRWSIPDYDQSKCIANVFDDLLVIARAGSGKTSTIINRVSFLVNHCGVLPSEILVLAFNKEAANEVEKRLKNLLADHSPQAMTFHALAYSIVHPEEALIFDDKEGGYFKSKTIQQVIDSYLKDETWHNRIRNFMIKYFKSDWDRIEIGGHLLSPKEMIKYRKSMPYMGLDGTFYKSKPEKVIADFLFEFGIPYLYEKNHWWNGINYRPDFTIESNNLEYSGIIIEYFGMVGNTDYDKQIREKRKYWETRPDYIFIELFSNQNINNEILVDILKKPLDNCGFEMRKLSYHEIWLLIKDRAIDDFSYLVSQFIGRCRKELITPDDLKDKLYLQRSELSDLHIDFIKIVFKIYSEYLSTLQMNNEEDFDGLMIKAAETINNGQTSWNRISGSGDLKSLKYLFIDEYQDFTKLFHRLIHGIKVQNRNIKLFCVGDDWQAINGFAGSDLKYLKKFNDYFQNAKQLSITTNYRSHSNIVDVSNELMKGEGIISKSVSSSLGQVYLAYLNTFTPNDFEINNYKGDLITPALIRIINKFVIDGQRVAILTRRRNGIPFYNNSWNSKNFQADFLSRIRGAFSEDIRHLIVDFNTVHSYKGKEEDVIIVADVMYNSFPLIHPNNVFFEIIGSTFESIIAEEKRLLYVALSRAKKTLIIISEQEKESPFLTDEILNRIKIDILDIDRLSIPVSESKHFVVRVYNSFKSNNQKEGTYVIRQDLKAFSYRWDSRTKSWSKSYSIDTFSIERLMKETWVKKGDNIGVSITDEFDNKIHSIEINNGRETILF